MTEKTIICPTISQMGNQDRKKSSDLFKVTLGFCSKIGELETWTWFENSHKKGISSPDQQGFYRAGYLPLWFLNGKNNSCHCSFDCSCVKQLQELRFAPVQTGQERTKNATETWRVEPLKKLKRRKPRLCRERDMNEGSRVEQYAVYSNSRIQEWRVYTCTEQPPCSLRSIHRRQMPCSGKQEVFSEGCTQKYQQLLITLKLESWPAKVSDLNL